MSENVENRVIENWETNREIFNNLKSGDIIEGGKIVKDVTRMHGIKFISTCSRINPNRIVSQQYSWAEGQDKIQGYASSVFGKTDEYPLTYNKMNEFLKGARL